MEYKFKFIVLGDYSCGKTSLLTRITNNNFNYNYQSTIGVDYFVKKYYYNELFDDEISVLEDGPSMTTLKPSHENNSIELEPTGKSSIKIRNKEIKNRSSDFRRYMKLKNKIEENDITFDLRIWDTSGQERFSKLINAYYKNLSGAIIMFDITNHRSFQSVSQWYKDLMENINSDKEQFPVIIVGNKIDCERSRVVEYIKAVELATRLNAIYIESSVKEYTNLEIIFSTLIEKLVDKIDSQHITPSSNNSIQILSNGAVLEFSDNTNEDSEEIGKKCCIIS